jgi:hypothetical protein
LVEVKYESDLKAQRERLAAAFTAAEDWAHAHQARFRIATETQIRGGLLGNAKRLSPLRTLPLDAKMAMLALTHAHRFGRSSFGVLLELLPDRNLALATLWRLIARGELRTELSVPITNWPNSRVSSRRS